MFDKTKSLILIALALLLAACTTPVTEPEAEEGTPGTEQPAAVVEALRTFSQAISTAQEEIEIVSLQQQEWTDGCLGLGQADEACIQAIVPGWQVVVRVGDQQYEVRTDMTGSTVRWTQS